MFTMLRYFLYISVLTTSAIAAGQRFNIWNSSRVKGFTSEDVLNLTPDQIQILTTHQIRSLTPDQIQILTTQQIRSLTPGQLRNLTPQQIQGFSDEQIQSFTNTQRRSFLLTLQVVRAPTSTTPQPRCRWIAGARRCRA